MNLPFTAEQFLGVFSDYNRAVWPAQIVFNLGALAAIVLAVRKTRITDPFIGALLGLLWLWMGIVYHWVFFSAINKAAYLFGALFVLQGVFFLGCGLIRKRLAFGFTTSPRGVAGASLILYALVIYPLLGNLLGHVYPARPTFGLPCPTTIFTFGMMLWSTARIPVHLWIIPLLWSVIGFMAALKLGIREDIGLLVAGVVAVVFYLTKRNGAKAKKNKQQRANDK